MAEFSRKFKVQPSIQLEIGLLKLSHSPLVVKRRPHPFPGTTPNAHDTIYIVDFPQSQGVIEKPNVTHQYSRIDFWNRPKEITSEKAGVPMQELR